MKLVSKGETITYKQPSDMHSRERCVSYIPLLSLESILIYDEAHADFLAPWSFIVAFKDVTTRKRWYRSSAQIELDLSRRILPNAEGKTSLRYFDGATMKSYQLPGKIFEAVYCRQQEQPHECKHVPHQGINGFNAPSSFSFSPLLERHVNHMISIQFVIGDNIGQNTKPGSSSDQQKFGSEVLNEEKAHFNGLMV